MATMREIRAAMLDDARGVSSNTELYERRDRLTIELQLVVRYEPLPIRTPAPAVRWHRSKGRLGLPNKSVNLISQGAPLMLVRLGFVSVGQLARERR